MSATRGWLSGMVVLPLWMLLSSVPLEPLVRVADAGSTATDADAAAGADAQVTGAGESTAAAPPGLMPLYPDLPLLEQGIDLLYRTDYAGAQQALRRVAMRHPRHPAGPLFLSLVDFAMLFEGADLDPRRDRHFLAAIDTTLARARPLVDDRRMEAVGRFYLGSAFGFRARHRAMQGQWWGAYRDGKHARDELEKAVALDEACVDANLGLGVYHVVTDLLPGYVKAFDWLLRIRGDRQRGLEELERARREGVLTRVEATYFLAMLATEFDHRYEAGLGLARLLVRQYPHNPQFRALEARSLMGLGEYELAEGRLRSLYLGDIWRRPHHAMRQSAFELGRLLVRRGETRAGRALLEHHFAAADDPFTWFLPWAQVYTGIAAELDGDREAARSWFGRAKQHKDRAGSRRRADEWLEREMKPAARELLWVRSLARTRTGAPESLRRAVELVGTAQADGSLEAEQLAELRWTAALAAMRAGRPTEAARHFSLAIRAGVDAQRRGLCLLGRAAALAAAGDTTGAHTVYEAIQDQAGLRLTHGRARSSASLLATRGGERLPWPMAGRRTAQRSRAVAPAGQHRRITVDCVGPDWLLAPAIMFEPLGGREPRVILHGAGGRFSGWVEVPAGGLRYRLRLPGLPSRLDPSNPLVVEGSGGYVVSFLPAAREPRNGAPWNRRRGSLEDQ